MKLLNKYINMFILLSIMTLGTFAVFYSIKYFDSIRTLFINTKEPIFYEASKTSINTANIEKRLSDIDTVTDVSITTSNTVTYINIKTIKNLHTADITILEKIETELVSELNNKNVNKSFVDIYVSDNNANVVIGYYDYNNNKVVWK